MVNSVLGNSNKKGIRFLSLRQETILSAAFILSITSGVNAVLGLVRGRLLTHYFGVSDSLSIFYTADKIPSLTYSILIVGALSTVFIPSFTQHLKKSESYAWKVASTIINVTLGFFIILGVLLFVFATPIFKLLSVNQFTSAQVALGAHLMRTMLLAQLILLISSFITSILHSFKHFLLPAFSPIFYSIGMLLGIIFLSDSHGIFGPAYGVIIGAFLHLLIQLPILMKIDVKYTFFVDLRDKSIRKIFSLVPPRILSVLISNIILVVNNSLAILISATSVVYLKFASQLQYFPVSLFGVSIAAAMLPTISEEASEKNYEGFKKTFITSLHQMLFLVVPVSVILLVLRIPVVRLVYGVANFPWEATLMTAYTLAFFSISIFSQSINVLLTRSFYALKDTKTPVKVSLITVILNIALSLTFIKLLNWGVWSVALSFSITSLIDTLVLLYLLSKKLGGFEAAELVIPFTKISYSAFLMGVFLYLPLKVLDQYVFDTTRTVNLLILTFVTSAVGITVYLVLTKLFRVKEIMLFYKLVRKLRVNLGLETLPTVEKSPIEVQ